MEQIEPTRQLLLKKLKTLDDKAAILRAPELKSLYAQIPKLEAAQRAKFGQQINQLRAELEKLVKQSAATTKKLPPIDVTAPFNVNSKMPSLLPTQDGTVHPLMSELELVIDIFTRMGFKAVESRSIDDDFHMFTSLNFPENHPARDAYDTFRTEEGLVPPAHTSNMQNRILKAGKKDLEKGTPIASISFGRCFRNEDLDVTHEHTFYQVEGVYVSDSASLSNMLAVLRSFFETYYGQKLKIKTQPAYFPFVEPGLEFAIEKPATLGGKSGEWLEMLGCGMIHPNVLKLAGIDSKKYRGFAWGGGIERLVMLKYGIEDLRHFESAKLDFLRKFV